MAILPAFQGQGLAKPLLAITCQRLLELGHQQAHLSTDAVRIPAIRLYLKFGFEPDIQNAQDERVWEEINRVIARVKELK